MIIRLGLNIWEVEKVTAALEAGVPAADLAKAYNTTEDVIKGFTPEKMQAASKGISEREQLSADKLAAQQAAADIAAAMAAKIAAGDFTAAEFE